MTAAIYICTKQYIARHQTMIIVGEGEIMSPNNMKFLM